MCLCHLAQNTTGLPSQAGPLLESGVQPAEATGCLAYNRYLITSASLNPLLLSLLRPLIRDRVIVRCPVTKLYRGEMLDLDVVISHWRPGANKTPSSNAAWPHSHVLGSRPTSPRAGRELRLWSTLLHLATNTETQRGLAACLGSHSKVVIKQRPGPGSPNALTSTLPTIVKGPLGFGAIRVKTGSE